MGAQMEVPMRIGEIQAVEAMEEFVPEPVRVMSEIVAGVEGDRVERSSRRGGEDSEEASRQLRRRA